MAKNNTEIVATPEEVVTVPTPRANSLTPAELSAQLNSDKKMRTILKKFIKDSMTPGLDYGHISIKGAKTKDTLLKPGAEKFCGLFKIRPTFRKDTDTWEMLGNKPGVIAYICELVDAQGQIIGEGRGTSSVKADGGDYDVNKVVKIAEKRAQIDAVLRTGALSDFFTQDIEDMPDGEKKAFAPKGGVEYKATPKQKNFIMILLTKKLNVDKEDVVQEIKSRGIEDPAEMTGTQASDLIEKLNAEIAELDKKKKADKAKADAEAQEVLDEAEVVEPEKPTVDTQYIADVDAKFNELGISAQDKMHIYKDVTGNPYSPKEDNHWIAVSEHLDELAIQKAKA